MLQATDPQKVFWQTWRLLFHPMGHESPRGVGGRREAVRHGPPPADRPSAEAAARALLGARAGYGAGSGEVKLATYQAESISLVANALDGPMVQDVTRGMARLFLDEWRERMLRTEADYEEQVEKDGHVDPYMDSLLRSSNRHYAKFIK